MDTHTRVFTAFITAGLLTTIPNISSGLDGITKRGCVYFERVCMSCHREMTDKSIMPDGRTRDEWRAYIKADKHDITGRTNPSLRYYVSKEYRQTILKENKAAEKLEDYPDDILLRCVHDFLMLGARDADRSLSHLVPN